MLLLILLHKKYLVYTSWNRSLSLTHNTTRHPPFFHLFSLFFSPRLFSILQFLLLAALCKEEDGVWVCRCCCWRSSWVLGGWHNKIKKSVLSSLQHPPHACIGNFYMLSGSRHTIRERKVGWSTERRRRRPRRFEDMKKGERRKERKKEKSQKEKKRRGRGRLGQRGEVWWDLSLGVGEKSNIKQTRASRTVEEGKCIERKSLLISFHFDALHLFISSCSYLFQLYELRESEEQRRWKVKIKIWKKFSFYFLVDAISCCWSDLFMGTFLFAVTIFLLVYMLCDSLFRRFIWFQLHGMKGEFSINSWKTIRTQRPYSDFSNTTWS